MNNSLLGDPEYVKIIKNSIKRVTCQYAIVDGEPEYFHHMSNEALENFYLCQTPKSLQTFPLKINP